MIRENQIFFNRLNIVIDAIIIAFSMPLAFLLRFYILPGGVVTVPLEQYLKLNVLLVPTALLFFTAFGLYESFRGIRLHRELERLFVANLLDTVIAVVLLFLLHALDFSRWVLALYFLTSTLLLGAKRIALRVFLRHLRRTGRNNKQVVIIGYGQLAERYLAEIRKDRNLGFRAAGYVADRDSWKALPQLGMYADLEKILEQIVPDEAVAAMSLEDYEMLPHIIAACEKTGTKLSVIPFYAAYLSANPQVDVVGDIPLLNLRRIPLDNMGNAFLKRCVDIIGSLMLIVMTSPIMLIAAIGVRVTSPGEIIFRQERVGRDKKPFHMYKFRSMRKNNAQNTAWSKASDPRKTKFGAVLRKFSIDELPQFFNVLKGDMSLVGPRPEIPHFVEQFKEDIPMYMVKHQVRPGITGWAQVNGLRGDTSIKARIEHDLYYIENWNFLFDIKILFMTLFKGVVNSEKIG